MLRGAVHLKGLYGRRGGVESKGVLDVVMHCNPSHSALHDDLATAVNYVPAAKLGCHVLEGSLAPKCLVALVAGIPNVQPNGTYIELDGEPVPGSASLAAGYQALMPTEAALSRAHRAPSVRCRPLIGFAEELKHPTPIGITVETYPRVDTDVSQIVQGIVNSFECHMIERVACLLAARLMLTEPELSAVETISVTVDKPSVGRLTATELESASVFVVVHRHLDAALLQRLLAVPPVNGTLIQQETPLEYLTRVKSSRPAATFASIQGTEEAALSLRAYEERACDEYEAMRSIVAQHVKRFNRPIRVLDIGAGSGALASAFAAASVTYYEAIEPNTHHHEHLESQIAAVSESHHVSSAPFSCTWACEHTYDVVLMSHSLYEMKDPVQSVRRAAELLTADGMVIVIHQGNGRLADIVVDALGTSVECDDAHAIDVVMPMHGDESDDRVLQLLTGRRIDSVESRAWAKHLVGCTAEGCSGIPMRHVILTLKKR